MTRPEKNHAETAHKPGFTGRYRVYYEDTDAGGVMYHSRYLNFFERARTDWLRTLGLEQNAIARQHNVVFAVRRAQVDFIQPARLDDKLMVTCELLSTGFASLVFRQTMRHENGNLLARADIKAACVRASDFRPQALKNTPLAPLLPSRRNSA